MVLTMTNDVIKIYNTASKQVEVFTPVKDGEVSMYACGPTVYNYAHIGNMRAYVQQDLFRRMFEREGYKVNHVMNITDVGHLESDADEGEDKMLLAAKRENKTAWDVAEYYTNSFVDHAAKLNIFSPGVVCKATDHIDDMIAQIQQIIDNGHAYVSNGNVYFDVNSFPQYADFAGLVMDHSVAENRVEYDLLKRDQKDFALWFSLENSKFPNQEMRWKSPWSESEGFPGWHIECSAMATRYLGEHFDIHFGGHEHIRVHHTNEIAQAHTALQTDQWVNYWVHNEWLFFDGEKMSKSLGNVVTVENLIENGYDPLSFRYLLLTGHYRNSMNFTYDSLDAAANALNKIRRRYSELQEMMTVTSSQNGEFHLFDTEVATNLKQRFWQAIFNDMDTPVALAIVPEVLRNQNLTVEDEFTLLKEFDFLLGVGFDKFTTSFDIPYEVQALFNQRDEARRLKDWGTADTLKSQIQELGYDVQDLPEGSSLVPIL